MLELGYLRCYYSVIITLAGWLAGWLAHLLTMCIRFIIIVVASAHVLHVLLVFVRLVALS
jgi:hypothetical protein